MRETPAYHVLMIGVCGILLAVALCGRTSSGRDSTRQVPPEGVDFRKAIFGAAERTDRYHLAYRPVFGWNVDELTDEELAKIPAIVLDACSHHWVDRVRDYLDHFGYSEFAWVVSADPDVPCRTSLVVVTMRGGPPLTRERLGKILRIPVLNRAWAWMPPITDNDPWVQGIIDRRYDAGEILAWVKDGTEDVPTAVVTARRVHFIPSIGKPIHGPWHTRDYVPELVPAAVEPIGPPDEWDLIGPPREVPRVP